MSRVLKRCIDHFGPAPRPISWWDHMVKFNYPKPKWLKKEPDDQLNLVFDYVETLIRDGRVVWGAIIQANYLLFEDDENNAPAEIVFSLDPVDNVTPEFLLDVAADLASLKDTQPDDPELRVIADRLTSEDGGENGAPVPHAISPDIQCYTSCIYIVRNYLPLRWLNRWIIPIIVNPTPPHVVMPLHKQYWPGELIQWWSE